MSLPHIIQIPDRVAGEICAVCGCSQFREKYGPIRQCRACGLGMVVPLLPFRGEHETEDYFLQEYLPAMLVNRGASTAERLAHLQWIAKYFDVPASPKLLDVGCALGFMLEAATKLGWKAEGVETSEFAARYAQRQTGCKVYAGTLERAALLSSSFDIVTLTDVIEHVPAPARLIQEIFRVLRPGGVFYIVTPNFSSLFVKFLGLRAYGIWPDQHVVYFSPRSLHLLLQQNGFSRIRVTTKDIYGPNLQHLRRKPVSAGAMKSAFAKSGPLRFVRSASNLFFSCILWGDKLIAGAQKPAA